MDWLENIAVAAVALPIPVPIFTRTNAVGRFAGVAGG
jgi:hypothetical protein